MRLEGDVMRIEFAWRCGEYALLGLFLLACMAALVTLWIISPTPRMAALALILGPLCIIAEWPVLAGLLNRTVIEASPQAGLRVRHGPIPWLRSLSIPAGQAAQFYIEQIHAGPRWGSARLKLALHDGDSVWITWLLPPGHASWAAEMERELERHLGIFNRPAVCTHCGYDLRMAVHQCPECGQKIKSTRFARRQWAAEIARLTRGRRGR